MNVRQLIEILQQLPQDLEVEVNNQNGGEVYAIEEVTHYHPTTSAWHNDSLAIVLQVNRD